MLLSNFRYDRIPNKVITHDHDHTPRHMGVETFSRLVWGRVALVSICQRKLGGGGRTDSAKLSSYFVGNPSPLTATFYAFLNSSRLEESIAVLSFIFREEMYILGKFSAKSWGAHWPLCPPPVPASLWRGVIYRYLLCWYWLGFAAPKSLLEKGIQCSLSPTFHDSRLLRPRVPLAACQHVPYIWP